MAEIKKIKSASEIPLFGCYVLVMSGVSTYETFHSRGATFAINDGPKNRARAAEKAIAMRKAKDFAAAQKLPVIYLLE